MSWLTFLTVHSWSKILFFSNKRNNETSLLILILCFATFTSFCYPLLVIRWCWGSVYECGWTKYFFFPTFGYKKSFDFYKMKIRYVCFFIKIQYIVSLIFLLNAGTLDKKGNLMIRERTVNQSFQTVKGTYKMVINWLWPRSWNFIVKLVQSERSREEQKGVSERS